MDTTLVVEEPTFAQRVAGRFVDSLLLLPVVLVVRAAVTTDRRAVAAVTIMIGLGYEVGATARYGRTLGKRLVGTRIMRLATGTTPGPQVVTLRYLALSVGTIATMAAPRSPIGPILWLIVIIPILRPPEHRGLHDRLSGTVVSA